MGNEGRGAEGREGSPFIQGHDKDINILRVNSIEDEDGGSGWEGNESSVYFLGIYILATSSHAMVTIQRYPTIKLGTLIRYPTECQYQVSLILLTPSARLESNMSPFHVTDLTVPCH